MFASIVLPAWVFYPIAAVVGFVVTYYTILFIKQRGK